MKYTFVTAIGIAMIVACAGCKDSRYVDPSTGRTLSLVKDENTGLLVDEETKKPVYIYVDTQKKDTIFGETGKVINGQIVFENGKYKYEEYKVKADNDGEYKKKVEDDGDVKIKTDDKKIKIDGETGERKVKKD